jgi:glycyl-tRNA synthetase beta chain
MQAKAEADLGKAIGYALKAAGLSFSDLRTVSGPRRLAVMVDGVPEKSADVREERKGPKVGAPEQAVAGFMRSAGLSDISQAEVRSDPKKGDFYVAVIEKQGRSATDIIAEAVPEIVRGFHWPKSMRWGTGDLRWVRPLQRILCVLGGAVVPFEVDGLVSGNQTEGHRVHGRGPFTVTGWEDYQTQLEGAGHVKLSREDRSDLIRAEATRLCKEAGLELVEDEGLLQEVTGLAEWPVPVLGAMDPAFLDLPPEVVKLSMRTHQKYFAVRDPKTGALAPNFVTVANIEAADGGAKIAAGNAKVLSARLDDARFFWDNDKKVSLEALAPKLAKIEFKKELGSIADKVERVAVLARELAPKVGADPDLAERAARLAKADLVSEMVYEFPELQGVMGRYYALEAGEDPAVADAIADHYQPQGPSNPVPTAPVSIAVALADKLDTAIYFWGIPEQPTGSKDPFALRRASLGIVRIILENAVRLNLTTLLTPIAAAALQLLPKGRSHWTELSKLREDVAGDGSSIDTSKMVSPEEALVFDYVLVFLKDRLKQYLRDKGERHDLIDAVFALGEDDLVLITKRVSALGKFLDTEDGTNLLAGYKRATNILKAEEKKSGERYSGEAQASKLVESAEKVLFTALTKARKAADTALEKEDFEGAMAALAPLRAPVDLFFDSVTVNTDDAAVRQNRLLILASMRDALHCVADFSRIEAKG